MDEIKNVIEIKNITKDYGDFKLDNVSFNVTTGSVCGFIGQNGAGNIVFFILMMLPIALIDILIIFSQIHSNKMKVKSSDK